MAVPEVVKLYFDYKSPFAYLAVESAFALPERYHITLRWIPFLLRIKGKGERSQYSEWKAKYSYLDARRWANRRGGFPIKGPLKVYDSSPALIGGLFAQRHGLFRPYTEAVYSRFFQRELEIDLVDQVSQVLVELGAAAEEVEQFFTTTGPAELESCLEEAHADHVFGVPLFVVRGEPFWGHDRMPLLEERLTEYGLSR